MTRLDNHLRAATIAVMRSALALLVCLVPAASMAAAGRCLLEVDNRPILLGPCVIDITQDGSFTISDGKRKPDYFAQLDVEGPNSGSGYWNEERGAARAQASLGVMMRQGACWTNEKARICTWR